ncbi:N-acetylmuramoyl-L-alanine amidase CwlD [Clostridium fermenticellae]|uniref:N-acetylmuramoyl-L-alanine amidase CwlD n=1 Tax=Clostridium fermenticellae TaxID=2068654 RepID=A0A386H0T4_9CLOT|nr:N-acetylmuramoyl-L-alanine amidase CwlD [Clostridium fermenticellae]AYD39292.1 N-acetylmuramoyl-L-alanine amidase CwlD [Clostridium fermenticellae]
MKLQNRRKLITLMTIIILLTSILFTDVKSCVSAHENGSKKTILIDPGHGGIDGGAQSKSGICEKDINLSISKKLKDMLENNGYKVIMTREKDIGLYDDNKTIRQKKVQDLSRRCQLKKDSNCNLFISIHLNMFSETAYSGAQVWYSRNPESKGIAAIIQQNLKRDLDPNNNRKEKAALDSYKVLRCNDSMPSIIVECGFLSNVSEEQKLKTDEYQTKIAKSLFNSIDQYFNSSKQ